MQRSAGSAANALQSGLAMLGSSGEPAMINVIPTRRPWFTAGRLALAVMAVAFGSVAVLVLAGDAATAVTCLASAA